MRIIVCIKQVPNTMQINVDPETGTLIREGIPSIINPDDQHALQAAISLKKEIPTTVTALSMGPPQCTYALREALAMGCDEAYLITGKSFSGADTLATSYLLSQTIRKIGGDDLILCGRQAIDGDTAQVGPELAEWLQIPQITYVTDISLSKEKITAKRKLEDGIEVICSPLPCLLTILQEMNDIRLPSLPDVLSAFLEKKIYILEEKDFSITDFERFGLAGSPTRVFKTFAPKRKEKGWKSFDEPEKAVKELLFQMKKDEQF